MSTSRLKIVHLFYYIRSWHIVLLLNLAYLAVILAVNGADSNVFVTIGECFNQCTGQDGTRCPAGTDGYDGQFAYYIARDPAGSPGCLDVPAYRMQRILLPLLGRLFSLGQTSLIPAALVLINLVALAGGTAILEDLLLEVGVKRWFALSYGLFAGVFMAVRLSTPEPLAYGLVIAALWLGRQDRWLSAGVLLALAALAKETALLFTIGVILYLSLNRRRKEALIVGLITGVPFAAWQVALYLWLGEFGLGSGGALGTPFEIIPYNGVWRIATERGIEVLLLWGIVIFPAAVLPGLWALWRSVRDLISRRWDLTTCLLLANAATMPFLPFSTYREYLGLLRFLPGLVLVTVLYAAQHKLHRPLRYSTLWIALLLFIVAG